MIGEDVSIVIWRLLVLITADGESGQSFFLIVGKNVLKTPKPPY